MDLQLTPKHLEFRDQLRRWLAANMRRPWREELRDSAATEDGLSLVRALVPIDGSANNHVNFDALIGSRP